MKWHVVTSTGLSVYEGSRRNCNAYLRQARKKGSPEGFLTIISSKEFEQRGGVDPW